MTGKLFSDGPKGHPHIDTTHCIDCGTCTSVRPEGDALAMLAGKAVIVNGHKCIGSYQESTLSVILC